VHWASALRLPAVTVHLQLVPFLQRRQSLPCLGERYFEQNWVWVSWPQTASAVFCKTVKYSAGRQPWTATVCRSADPRNHLSGLSGTAHKCYMMFCIPNKSIESQETSLARSHSSCQAVGPTALTGANCQSRCRCCWPVSQQQMQSAWL
jgi:hypothetical protein